MNISIHPASLSEQISQYELPYHVGEGWSLEDYLARCRSSVRRGRAQCWVLTLDNVVFLPWGVYLCNDTNGNIIDGFGIASVYTRDDMRKRGFAERICTHVIEKQRQKYAHIGLLFSDVRPSYYEKMGFTLLSQMSHDCRRLAELLQSGPKASLQSFDPLSKMDWLHKAIILSIHEANRTGS